MIASKIHFNVIEMKLLNSLWTCRGLAVEVGRALYNKKLAVKPLPIICVVYVNNGLFLVNGETDVPVYNI